MAIAGLIIAVVAVLVSAYAFVLAVGWPRRRLAIRRRVLVQLTDTRAIAGVLMSRRGGMLVLEGATVHDEGQAVAATGQVLVEAARVAWVQVIPVEGS